MADSNFTAFAFANSGTGAVARTMPARLADIVNVKDWGAVGDGLTDDHVAIQNAINYAVSTSTRGAYVYFPPGTYNTGTTAIDISPFSELTDPAKNICIVGAGRNRTIVKGSVNTNNPPFGSTQWQSGVVPSDNLPASAVFWASHGAGHMALMSDMTIWNTSIANVWCFALVMGYFQPITTFRNLRFKGRSGAMFNEAYGIVVQDCVAESISTLSANQTGAGPDANTTMTSVPWSPARMPGVTSVNCYTGTVGIGVNQGETIACHAIGPFDVGFALCGIGQSVRGLTAKNCGIGLYCAMSAGGDSGPYVNSGQCGDGQIAACVFDRCLVGVIGNNGANSFVANVISGVQGPADPAAMTMTYNSSSHVVTVTTAVNHNAASGPLYLSVPNDWLSTADSVDGIVNATVTSANQFTYAGPLTTPTSPGSGAWNYPVYQAIRRNGSTNALMAANVLSAVAANASVEVGRTVQAASMFMAMEGKYGWKEYVIDPYVRYQAGLQFFSCGTTDSNRISAVSNNPLVPSLKFQNLPNVMPSQFAFGDSMMNYNPPQALVIGQQYWITDGTTTSIGSPVGGMLPLSSSASLGATTLNFTTVPSWVVNPMKVNSHRDFTTHTEPMPYGGATVQSTTSTTVTIAPGTALAIATGTSIIFGGGGSNTYLVRFDGANWIRIA